MSLHFFKLLFLATLLTACQGDSIGTPCTRKGDGFTARHNCETLCMSIWKIQCADGQYGNSNVCGGELNCRRHGCPMGQVCYQTNFDRSVCVPESICPEWVDSKTHPKIELKSLDMRKDKSPLPKTEIAPL